MTTNQSFQYIGLPIIPQLLWSRSQISFIQIQLSTKQSTTMQHCITIMGWMGGPTLPVLMPDRGGGPSPPCSDARSFCEFSPPVPMLERGGNATSCPWDRGATPCHNLDGMGRSPPYSNAGSHSQLLSVRDVHWALHLWGCCAHGM
jgi:hypothetical protein